MVSQKRLLISYFVRRAFSEPSFRFGRARVVLLFSFSLAQGDRLLAKLTTATKMLHGDVVTALPPCSPNCPNCTPQLNSPRIHGEGSSPFGRPEQLLCCRERDFRPSVRPGHSHSPLSRAQCSLSHVGRGLAVLRPPSRRIAAAGSRASYSRRDRRMDFASVLCPFYCMQRKGHLAVDPKSG